VVSKCSNEEMAREVRECQEKTEKLCCKIRMSLVIHLTLVLMAVKLQKFQMVLQLLSVEDIQKIINFDNFKLAYFRQEIYKMQTILSVDKPIEADEVDKFRKLTILVDQSSQTIHFQNLKTYVQSFKQSIEKRIHKYHSLNKVVTKRKDTLEVPGLGKDTKQ
jgi:hypothetical protein